MVNGTIRFHIEYDKCYSYYLTTPKYHKQEIRRN